jgi:hypothetical protein
MAKQDELGNFFLVHPVHFVRQICMNFKRHTFGYGECRRPLIPQDVQTNRAIAVDVGMVDLGREADLGRFEGIICGECDGKEEDATRVWRIALCVKECASVVGVGVKQQLEDG